MAEHAPVVGFLRAFMDGHASGDREAWHLCAPCIRASAGDPDQILKGLAYADLIILDELDEFVYVPFDVDGARLLYQIIAGACKRRSIIFTANIEFGKWGTIFTDDKLAAVIIDRIVHHGRIIEFHGPSRRMSGVFMFDHTNQ